MSHKCTFPEAAWTGGRIAWRIGTSWNDGDVFKLVSVGNKFWPKETRKTVCSGGSASPGYEEKES